MDFYGISRENTVRQSDSSLTQFLFHTNTNLRACFAVYIPIYRTLEEQTAYSTLSTENINVSLKFNVRLFPKTNV